MTLPTGNIPRFILIGAGLDLVKPKLFRPAPGIESNREYNFDEIEITEQQPDAISYLGTPVFSNLIFPAGNFETLDGDIISYEELRIDTVLFTVTQTKNIVRTPIQGRRGTVKEYISDGDFLITVNGAIVSENPKLRPDEDILTLLQILKVPDTIKITSSFLNLFGITDVVVDSYDIPQEKGTLNAQFFTIRMSSDFAPELDVQQPVIQLSKTILVEAPQEIITQ